jgi:hypothetical protein
VYNYFANIPQEKRDDKRNILVRVIVPENDDVRDRIIIATNSQTPIPKASLRVNNPIHRQIEMYFATKGIYYDRRKNYYKNLGKKPSEIISVSFLAQCLISVLLQQPDYARARPSTVLDSDDKYNELYSESIPLEVFYKIAMVGKRIDLFLKSSQDIVNSEKTDIVFYVVYASVAMISKKINPTALAIERISLSAFTTEFISEITQRILHIYRESGGNSDVAKGPSLREALTSYLKDEI